MDDQTERMYELMRKESNRLKTFQMNPPWPKDYVDIKKLAKAGFFYAFNGDNVHCAFCRGQVCRWDRDDDPMSEHARHFTTCPFIMGGEVGNEPLGEDPFPGPKRPRPYDVCGAYPNFPPNDARSAQEYLIDHRQSANHDEDLQSNNSDQLSYNYGNNYNELQQQELFPHNLQQNNQQSQQILQYHRPASSESIPESPSQLSTNSSNSSNSSSSLNGICKICYSNAIELVFLPCGHSVSCLSCAQRLYSCPCCRATITTRIRTFLV